MDTLQHIRDITKAQIDDLAKTILEDMAPTTSNQFLALGNLLDDIARPAPHPNTPNAQQANQLLILYMEEGQIAPYLIARLSLMALLQIQLARAEKEAQEYIPPPGGDSQVTVDTTTTPRKHRISLADYDQVNLLPDYMQSPEHTHLVLATVITQTAHGPMRLTQPDIAHCHECDIPLRILPTQHTAECPDCGNSYYFELGQQEEPDNK